MTEYCFVRHDVNNVIFYGFVIDPMDFEWIAVFYTKDVEQLRMFLQKHFGFWEPWREPKEHHGQRWQYCVKMSRMDLTPAATKRLMNLIGETFDTAAKPHELYP